MKLVVYVYVSMIVLGVQAWPTVKRSFELYPAAAMPYNEHRIADCMHVASEPGDYIFKKAALPPPFNFNRDEALFELDAVAGDQLEAAAAAAAAAGSVCGLYVIGEPDTIVEITMKHYDVNCESGGLMAFVDGWELNGEYFPAVKDHHRVLEDRVYEFCNNNKQWPRFSNKKFFRSSQNAALLQYRIPTRGSFVANVRFHKITQPCNILVQDTAAVYKMSNYGHARNCTLSALFPAAVSLGSLRIGSKAVRAQEKVNYDCHLFEDRLEIGGSAGLDTTGMELASDVCGATNELGPEQAVFCGVTSVRLVSTGRYQNQAAVIIRKADEHDLDIATLLCAL
ncbi:corticotropin-releasing factor-binding protein isoform X1 [Drosophila novamexicana]|uniref:corticotropin-releasing factor-binding protein isoform X1 n=1 Tax=Drosophila novamexicana TaxID=47314 RepID=UPI0011E5F0ED|nr:corticotropin-releasing factor-binding protein isoform X1 [Drosophila novamexicana]